MSRILVIINILIICVLFRVSNCFSQGSGKFIRMGDDAFNEGDYYAAYLYYEEALKLEPSNIELLWKSAEACRLFHNYIEAASKYKTIFENDKSDKYSDALFWYAMMLKQLGNYQNAKVSFRQFVNFNKDKKNNKLLSRAKMEIEACELADSLIKDSLNVIITHLGENINTPYAESAPFRVKDSIFIYASLQLVQEENNESFIPIETEYLTKIFKAKIENQKLGDPEEYKEINFTGQTKIHNTAAVFSPDNKRVYFTRCEEINMSKYRCNIYVSEFSKGKFKEPKRLNDSINYPGCNTTHPMVSIVNNKEVLWYASDRPGGYGGMDIWYCIITDGKKYSRPFNAGKVVNTPWDEITPYYSEKQKKLFFSSDGHKGLGGLDIFYSVITDLTKPSPVRNIGYPINSPANDFFFTVNQNDTNGYFTSNRKGSFYIKGETCCNDIYSYQWQKKEEKKEFKKDTTKLQVTKIIKPKKDTITIEQKIREMLPITLYFHNDEPDRKTMKTTTEKDYEQCYYEYIAMKDEYAREFSKGLEGKAKDEAIAAINKFFDETVRNGYEKLVRYSSLLLSDLQKGKTVKITVKGYCSPLTTNEYNKNLSKRRISSLVNYLKKYQNGVIKPYIEGTAPNGGKLIIIEEPLGEEKASSTVSDNPNDKRNSVYSIQASLERKIQILKYSSEGEIVENPVEIEINSSKERIFYRIQLLSSALPIPKEKFDGLHPVVSQTNKRGITSYFAGEFSNLSDAEIARSNLVKIGFKDAIIVAFLNDRKISLAEAKQLLEEGKVIENPEIKSNLFYNDKIFYDREYD